MNRIISNTLHEKCLQNIEDEILSLDSWGTVFCKTYILRGKIKLEKALTLFSYYFIKIIYIQRKRFWGLSGWVTLLGLRRKASFIDAGLSVHTSDI